MAKILEGPLATQPSGKNLGPAPVEVPKSIKPADPLGLLRKG